MSTTAPLEQDHPVEAHVTLHPALARTISAAIISRSVAHDMIDVVTRSQPFNYEHFCMWKEAHMQASATLADLGIDVPTYKADPDGDAAD